ncbi:MAG: ATP synthase subunit I [Gammaproteobacteria bacterium]|nr:ATP synthase subunit I [Gammaproteobacteria bacterium]
MLTDDRRVVLLTLLAQTGVSLGLAGLLALLQGSVAAVSVLLGGLVAVIPNGFLAARLLKPRADDSARAIMRSAWIGEIGKLLLTALLFGVIFAVMRPIAAPAVFGGFIAAQLVIFGALLLGRSGGGSGGAGTEQATSKS